MNRFIKRFDSKNKEEEIKTVVKEYEEAISLEDSDGKDKATKKLLGLVDQNLIKKLIKQQDAFFNSKEDLIAYVDNSDVLIEFREFLVTLFNKKEIERCTETFTPHGKYSKEQLVRYLTVHNSSYEEIIEMLFRPQYILDIDIQRPIISKNLEEKFIKKNDGSLTGASMNIVLGDKDFLHTIRFDSYMSDILGSHSTKWMPTDSIDQALEMISQVIINKEWYPISEQ